jgi:hypothetical protein
MPWPITAAAAAATAVDVDGLNAASSGIRASPLAVDPIAEGRHQCPQNRYRETGLVRLGRYNTS